MVMAFWKKLRDTLEFVKFSHTVFALPFALLAMLAAARGLPPLRMLLLILACMVAARTAAMAFNRLADWEMDRKNPRTAKRSQLASRATAALLCGAGIALFVAASAGLNRVCLALSPVAVILILGYSVTKRFTSFPHFFLGLALAAAPMGAWAAVRGELLSPAPWVLAAGVLCWVFGFDLIYATLDVAFDREAGVRSFPARYGVPAALRLTTLLHLAAWGFFLAFSFAATLGWGFRAALLVAAAALVWEQRLSRSGDVGRINVAFFQVNALVGVALLAGAAFDLLR